jgi:hypothetical protein
MVPDNPDATPIQLCARLTEAQGVRVSLATMCRLVQCMDLPRNKSLHVSGSFQADTGRNRRRRASIIGIYLPNTSRTASNKAAISKGLARNRTAPERTAGNR